MTKKVIQTEQSKAPGLIHKESVTQEKRIVVLGSYTVPGREFAGSDIIAKLINH